MPHCLGWAVAVIRCGTAHCGTPRDLCREAEVAGVQVRGSSGKTDRQSQEEWRHCLHSRASPKTAQGFIQEVSTYSHRVGPFLSAQFTVTGEGDEQGCSGHAQFSPGNTAEGKNILKVS